MSRTMHTKAPHECSDPKCVGNINRQIIDLFPILLSIADGTYVGEYDGEKISNILTRAHSLQEVLK